MFNFSINTDGNISPSQQLIDQIQFAIASSQYPPGHRLPSTRQLAQITGLHRNTISKVYRHLEKKGLVESLAGSGIYVKTQCNEKNKASKLPVLSTYPTAEKIIKQSVDELVLKGCNLEQIKQLFLSEIDWRLRCNALLLITVPMVDLGVGKLIFLELKQELSIPIQLVPMEELSLVLTEANSATVVTSRYFISQVLEIVSPELTRVIALDIYDYKQELQIIKKLPENSSLGIVSLSSGILRGAEIIVHSLRGNEINVITAQTNNTQKLKNLVRSADTIICDGNSYLSIKKTLKQVEEDLMRYPKIFCTNKYINEKSINFLKKELSLYHHE